MKAYRTIGASLEKCRSVDRNATASQMQARIDKLRDHLAAIDERLRQLVPGVDLDRVATVFDYRARIKRELAEIIGADANFKRVL